MNLLVVTPRLLYPTDTGGKIRSARLLERLALEHRVTVVCFRDLREDNDLVQQMRACCERLETVTRREPKRGSLRFLAELVLRLFSTQSFVIAKYTSRELEARIRALLTSGSYDVIICDFLHPAQNVLNVGFHPRVLFQHNVEALIRKRHYQQARNPFTKLVLFLEWLKIRRFERSVMHAFDQTIMVSEEDRNIVAQDYGTCPTIAIPTAVDAAYFRPVESEADDNNLVFTGSMDWLPNEDAMIWFATAILPLIRRKIPATLWIVGRSPSRRIRALAEQHAGVHVTGTVPDVRPYVSRAKVYIVPLRIGGGTRIKIFEAMAMETPVVSTTVGAEGLPVTSGQTIFLADRERAFADEVAGLLRSPDRRRATAQRAAALVRDHYTWEAAAARFAEACEDTISRIRPR